MNNIRYFKESDWAAVWPMIVNAFRIIGTLPGAFSHQTLGFVDAHVMFKQLGM